MFCNVKRDCVIENRTVPILYEVSLVLEEQYFSAIVCRELHLETQDPDLSEWKAMVTRIRNRHHTVHIGLVGKYVQLHDAYLSVAEALQHAGYALDNDVVIIWIDSEEITIETVEVLLSPLNGILVPGGFGNRGIDGMLLAANYARVYQIPYFGICLGMQIAVIEFARNQADLLDANSGEFAPMCAHKAIDFMPGQCGTIEK